MPETVWRKVKEAQRRINLGRGVLWALLFWLILGSLACGLLLADRLFGWNLPEPMVLAFACLLALAGAILRTWYRPASPLEAALRLDQTLGLKERLSTLVSLPATAFDHPAAIALVHEAEAKAEKIDVAEAIPWRVPRWTWWSPAPLAVFVALAIGLGPIRWPGTVAATEVTPEERERVATQVKRLEQQVRQRQELLAREGVDPELSAIHAEIEQAARDLANNPKGTVDQTALKLSDLAQSVEQRQAKSDHLDKVKRSLAQLPRVGTRPEGASQEPSAESLQQALREGDFKKGAEIVRDLQKQLAEGKLSPQEKQQLAQKLKRLEEQIRQGSNLAERAKEIQKNLSPAEAQKVLEQLAKEGKEVASLEKLAEALGESAESLRQGESPTDPKASDPNAGPNADPNAGLSKKSAQDSEDWRRSMDQAEAILRDLQRTDTQRQALDDMLRDLNECRGGVCQKEGVGPGGGLGKGKGQGDRPEAEDKTRSRVSQARSQVTQGKSWVTGKTDGPIFAGQSEQQVQEAVAAASREADEAITHQPIPPDYRDHAREYFERLSGQPPAK